MLKKFASNKKLLRLEQSGQNNVKFLSFAETLMLVDFGRKSWGLSIWAEKNGFGLILAQSTGFRRFWPKKLFLADF